MSFGAPPSGGMDEYQRLMLERAGAQKRKRMIFVVVGLGAIGGAGYFYMKDKGKKQQAQVILDAGGRFAEKEKTDVGAFWNCVMASQIEIGNFQNADQVQQRIESSYFTAQKTYTDTLTTDCVPKLKRIWLRGRLVAGPA